MNILIVSQCSKNALKESRRILDQFAERRGDRTWQTTITLQGLETLRRLLRKRARKNTAVACHWIRGKDHSEMLWVVGDASRFNSQGAVPTNTTQRDILRRQDENDWHSAEEIRLLAAIAALFHDLGKSNRAFQKKLTSKKPLADALRHEWVSLRLFEAFVGGNDDPEWIRQLSMVNDQEDLGWLKEVLKDGEGKPCLSPFKTLPPLARSVGWLIVSHHRMPSNFGGSQPSLKALMRLPVGIYETWCGANIGTEGLAINERELREQAIKDCWKFDHAVPFNNSIWLKRARKHAQAILQRPRLFDHSWLSTNTHVLHMARLVLMLADHHYSSLTEPEHRTLCLPNYPLIANTRRDTGNPNQPLDEHLVGVEMHTGRIMHALPSLRRKLPHIAKHRGFKRRSKNKQFKWQDKAFDPASSMRDRVAENGFFGINMASTGCGKTLANGRIIYALSNQMQGARFTIAIGLRTLTLQTGDVYRDKLGLGSDDLAVLVGGGAVRDLHEHNHLNQAQNEIIENLSAQELLLDNSYVHYDGSLEPGPLATWLSKTRGVTGLLNAPILVCTIDHLMPASESIRGGHQIAPMLRLMTSDLVLDEPDDFGIKDLPALTRLVHWTGMLGTRLLLSSATLPPSLLEGLFNAYAEGRRIFLKNRRTPNQAFSICTAWFDEFTALSGEHVTSESFIDQHHKWVEKRLRALAKDNDVRRSARIVPLSSITALSDEELADQVAEVLKTQAHSLHSHHHSIDPRTRKRVSFGLIRMANINPLVDVIRAFALQGAESGCRLHLCCYHSQHPLLVRSNIEKRLDNILNRKEPDRIFNDPELRTILDFHAEPEHMFIVLATAVAEVGRDHDYDWAIVEPSSIRSIIQLAGRIRRHRYGKCKAPNLILMDTNIRHLKNGFEKPAYCNPGFEDKLFPLESHRLSDLLSEEQIANINAASRIKERFNPQPRKNLVDLEHEHIRCIMIGDSKLAERKLPAHYWWTTPAHLTGELQRNQPFRHDPQGKARFSLLYDEDRDAATFTRFENEGTQIDVGNLLHKLCFDRSHGVSIWGETNYLKQLQQIGDELEMEPFECSRRFGTVELPAFGAEFGWNYHPALGFSSFP